MVTTHTSKVYEQDLRLLREKIARMAALVEQMISDGMVALRTRDSELAAKTMKLDRQINRMEVESDELCLRLLATRQPVASDLRFITTALKLVTDLERIGDLGVNLGERVLELNAEPPLPLASELERLGDDTLATLREAMDIWVNRDVKGAREMLDRDDGIDTAYHALFEKVLAMMAADPSCIYRATRVQSIAKYLERVGDHAMNIAEDVIFLVEGTDIRHRNRRQDTSEFPPPVTPRGA